MNQLAHGLVRHVPSLGMGINGVLALHTLNRFSTAQASGLGAAKDAAARADAGGSNDAVDSFTQQLQAKTEQELAELPQQRGRPNAAAAAATPADEELTAEVGGPKGLEPTRFGAPPLPPPLCRAAQGRFVTEGGLRLALQVTGSEAAGAPTFRLRTI